ncbi:unnamed protein product [Triticum turgidum subsp. durum]|uniref:Secreted peptide n=1 Tax=Triticum turgidum subsp. durum TaxID=4567 RepID=A0A9R0RL49_TRITD|nr:unnamed protein product [Triticum turgidum subsp. durum]
MLIYVDAHLFLLCFRFACVDRDFINVASILLVNLPFPLRFVFPPFDSIFLFSCSSHRFYACILFTLSSLQRPCIWSLGADRLHVFGTL